METWKEIKGFEGCYEISSLGRVKSLRRTHRLGQNEVQLTEKIMALHFHHRGYYNVWLRRPGEHKKFFVHRLVADAFLNPAHTTDVVNHKNGIKTDNRAENLEWATFSENTRHYYDILKKGMTRTEVEEVLDPADLPF